MNGLIPLTGTSNSPDALQDLIDGLGKAALPICIALLAWYLLDVIAKWRIYNKTGEPGWKSLIPIYNIYVLFKRVWRTGYFWMMVLGALVVGVATALGTAGTAVSAMTALASVAQLLVLILNIMFNVKLARSFGKGVGFAIGLIFLNPIFMLILGFGSAKYVGADK